MNEMKTTGNISSIQVDIPQSEVPIFEFLAKKWDGKFVQKRKTQRKK